MFILFLVLATIGFLAIFLGLVHLSFVIEDKLLSRANDKLFDFEKRLLNGEVLHKDNIF